MSRRRSLSPIQVRAIRRMYENWSSISTIAKALGIPKSTVHEVANWTTYTDVRTPGVVDFRPRSGELMAYRQVAPGVLVAQPLPVNVDRARQS